MEKEKLANLIVKIRAEKKYDQLTMAKEIGISLNTLVKVEKEKDVTKLTYFKIINYLEKEGYNV